MEEKRKCDHCEKDATRFASPLGNPDEAAYCDEHFEAWCKYCEEQANKATKIAEQAKKAKEVTK